MATSGVARRYARAIFELARAEHDEDGWLRDLRTIQDILSNPELQRYLDNPAVGVEEKLQTLGKSLNQLGVQRRNFVFVLVENNRTNEISNIVSAFETEENRARGVVNARVTTAVPIDAPEQAFLAQRLEAITGRKVVMQANVDPAIIGGFVARVGDHLIDASVVGRLVALRARLFA